MTKLLSLFALAIGALVVTWIGLSFVGSDSAALLVTLAIAGVYVLGFIELLGYQRATGALSAALSNLGSPPDSLKSWLEHLPASLQNSVRLRIQGEHIGLPAPVLAPYLVGLLVMLGLLGTFMGMVDTLQGAVAALQGSTELAAIRAGLAAPINGLGMAFGTSVAGVAASAMLGFVATLSRRERIGASRQLDHSINTVLQTFSLAHNRDQTFKAMQQQAQALPEVASQLTTLVDKLEQLSHHLTGNQERFHQSTETVYSDLARAIDQSLQQSLAQSGRLAGESIQAPLQAMMEQINNCVTTTHQQLSTTTQQQLETLSGQFAHTSEAVNQAWQGNLTAQQDHNRQLLDNIEQAFDATRQQLDQQARGSLEAFDKAGADWLQQQQNADQSRLEHWHSALDKTTQQLQHSAASVSANTEGTARQLLDGMAELLQSTEQLVTRRIDSESNWLTTYNLRMDQLTAGWADKLDALKAAESERGDAAVARLAELERVVSEHLAKLGNRLEQPMTQLIQTATDTPRAAAELFEKMRAQLSEQIERDNALLADRRDTMAQLNALSEALQQTTANQHSVLAKLVSDSTDMLQGAGTRFAEHLDAEVTKLSGVTDHFTATATQMSSLGDAFGVAVELFNDSNTQLIDNLSRIEHALQHATEKSDEQLAYYIAQAREIIDHSLLSQQEVMEQLSLLSQSADPLTAEVG